jgi:hypothetical protein
MKTLDLREARVLFRRQFLNDEAFKKMKNIINKLQMNLGKHEKLCKLYLGSAVSKLK